VLIGFIGCNICFVGITPVAFTVAVMVAALPPLAKLPTDQTPVPLVYVPVAVVALQTYILLVTNLSKFVAVPGPAL
jgi:hypothetical protein